jgi:rhamnulokinase
MGGMSHGYVAIDLGAESGRVLIGVLEDQRLQLEEVHRFAHEPVWMPTGLHWDISGIWREIVAGLRKTADWARSAGVTLASVGVDTWGVDWSLVDEAGELVGLPHAYRDPRNTPSYEKVIAQLGRDRIYEITGIQFMALNTLYSLYAHKLADAKALDCAERLLFMPDLIHYWLCGSKAVEATIASTSQMIDCHTGDWARNILAELELPAHLFSPPVPPGTPLGTIREELAEETGLPLELRVVAPAAHDTASAVVAVPALESSNWCYLSSGTWSLLGAELPAPCVSSAAQAASFTNELGIGGTIRFLKNIPGLWLVQQCRRDFARQGQEFDYATLTQLASQSPAFRTLVDPAHASFQTPGDMPRKITGFARATNQPAPETPGQFVRTALESLALTYRDKLDTLESILGRPFDVVHVVGGGGKNALLCQMTADATERRVIVGPHEATAMGNALVQAMAAGEVANLTALRGVVRRSVELVAYEPQESADWHEAYARYQAVIRKYSD